MKIFPFLTAIFILSSTLLLIPDGGSSHSLDQRQEEEAAEEIRQGINQRGIQEGGIKISIPDIVLLNQKGEKIRFYSDLVKDRVVVINFIFTSCTTACPLLAATFSNLQDLMGDRLGKDFYLISISVDPLTDTPERLKAMAAKFHAGGGWTFVTGRKPEIDRLLRALGAFTLKKEDHSPIVLIGNDAQRIWIRTYGLAQPVKLAQLIDGMVNGIIK